MKSEVHVNQIKPHPDCYKSPPVPGPLLQYLCLCALAWTHQKQSQGALIPPEVTALTASGALLIQSHSDWELSPPSTIKLCFGSNLFSREHMGYSIVWSWRWNSCCHCPGRDLWGEEPCWICHPMYKPWKSEAVPESCLCFAVLTSIVGYPQQWRLLMRHWGWGLGGWRWEGRSSLGPGPVALMPELRSNMCVSMSMFVPTSSVGEMLHGEDRV